MIHVRDPIVACGNVSINLQTLLVRMWRSWRLSSRCMDGASHPCSDDDSW